MLPAALCFASSLPQPAAATRSVRPSRAPTQNRWIFLIVLGLANTAAWYSSRGEARDDGDRFGQKGQGARRRGDARRARASNRSPESTVRTVLHGHREDGAADRS